MEDITNDFISALAAANGIVLAPERLDPVRRQYEGFLRTLGRINTLPLPRETEPAVLFSLEPRALPLTGKDR